MKKIVSIDNLEQIYYRETNGFVHNIFYHDNDEESVCKVNCGYNLFIVRSCQLFRYRPPIVNTANIRKYIKIVGMNKSCY